MGELDEAEQRLAPWEERARTLDRVWAIAILARCRALLQAARGDLEGSFAAFDQALAHHARSVYPFEHSRTLLALGMCSGGRNGAQPRGPPSSGRSTASTSWAPRSGPRKPGPS